MPVTFKRWLGGASSTCLVQDSNGIEWALKLLSEGQQHTVSFAEAASYEIKRAIGLPCPEWRAIYVDRKDLLGGVNALRVPGLSQDLTGPYFASRFIQRCSQHVAVISTPTVVPESMTLRRLFLGAYVYDVWAANRDRRQMLSALTWDGQFRLYLYDNSHVFGLAQYGEAEWSRRRASGGMPFRNMARQDGSVRFLRTWTSLLRNQAPYVLNTVQHRLPSNWLCARTSAIRDNLMQRLDHLEELIVQDLFAKEIEGTGVDHAWDF